MDTAPHFNVSASSVFFKTFRAELDPEVKQAEVERRLNIAREWWENRNTSRLGMLSILYAVHQSITSVLLVTPIFLRQLST